MDLMRAWGHCHRVCYSAILPDTRRPVVERGYRSCLAVSYVSVSQRNQSCTVLLAHARIVSDVSAIWAYDP
eukprot:768633-Pyramimonas_sp.AAC.1